MSRVVILGTGMQGKATLFDLVKNAGVEEIIAADRDIGPLQQHVKSLKADNVRAAQLDAANPASIRKLLKGADVVIDLLPGMFALSVAELAVENGVSLVNAMYLANPGETDQKKREALHQRVHSLDKRAREVQVAVLPEMGMDPGLDLVLSGEAVRQLDETVEFWSYGAGFPEPEAANNPIQYKITWSFDGVLRSYVRPGRFLRDGKIVEVGATEVFSPQNTHIVEFDGVGRLEAFPNGDATHYAKLLGIEKTVRTMGRYVLRWPGHCDFWGRLAKLGFLSDAPIEVKGQTVVPREFVGTLLEPQVHYTDTERDIALISVDARGYKSGAKKRATCLVIDRRDLKTGFTAMARTTGFTASIGAQMILDGSISQHGVLSPVSDVPFAPFVEALGKRGIEVKSAIETW